MECLVVTFLPVFSAVAVVLLMQDKEVDNVIHVVVLDCERVTDEVAGRLVEDGQLQDDQPRRPDFEPDTRHLDHVGLGYILLLQPLDLAGVNLVDVPLLDLVDVPFMAFPEIHEDVADLVSMKIFFSVTGVRAKKLAVILDATSFCQT